MTGVLVGGGDVAVRMEDVLVGTNSGFVGMMRSACVGVGSRRVGWGAGLLAGWTVGVTGWVIGTLVGVAVGVREISVIPRVVAVT